MVLKDINDWVDTAKRTLDDANHVLQGLQEINDSDDVDEVLSYLDDFKSNRELYSKEMTDEYIKMTNTHLKKICGLL